MQVSENRWHLPAEVDNIVRRLMGESRSLSLEERQALELFLATGQLDFASRVKRTVNNIEGTYETRVFIGGSYKPHLATLIEIRDSLKQDGQLVPILASDYEMPREETHRYSVDGNSGIERQGDSLDDIDRSIGIFNRSPQETNHTLKLKEFLINLPSSAPGYLAETPTEGDPHIDQDEGQGD